MLSLWILGFLSSAFAGTGCASGEKDPALGRERLHFNHWVPTHSEDWGKVREMWLRVDRERTQWIIQITGKFKPVDQLPAGTPIEFRTRRGAMRTILLPEPVEVSDLVLKRIVLDLTVPDDIAQALIDDPIKTMRIAGEKLDWSYRFNVQSAATLRRALSCGLSMR